MTEPRSHGASSASIRHHYDLDPAFFATWLDPSMTYTAAAWDGQDTLFDAQMAKLDGFLEATCREPGSLLDVGCGWGSLLVRAIETQRATTVTGLTLAPQQAGHANERIADIGGAGQALVQDWEGFVPVQPYDAVISLGAIEHFAHPGLSPAARIQRYEQFFEFVYGALRPGGRLGLQSIVFDQSSAAAKGAITAFIEGDIFPESTLPGLPELLIAAHRWFHLERTSCHAEDYARTCKAWHQALSTNRVAAAAASSEEAVERYLRFLAAVRVGFRRGDWNLTRSIFVARRNPLESHVWS